MNISTSWKLLKWGELATLQYGKGLRGYQNIKAQYPVFGTNGQIGWYEKYLCPNPSVIIGRKGAYRGIYFSKLPFFVIDTAFYLKPLNEGVFDIKWAYYQLLDFDINRLDSGSAIPSTSREAFYEIPVLFPPLSTQRKISTILSAYDDLIENNNKRINILEVIAKSIYREWFVNFHFPGYESVPMVDSSLGHIPGEWKIAKVGDIAHFSRGKSYKSSELVEQGGKPFINLKCIDRDGGFRWDGLKRFHGIHKETHIAKPGEIIVAVTDMTPERRVIARAALVPYMAENEFVFSMDLVKITPIHSGSNGYLYAMLRWSGFSEEVKNHANGANVLHLNPECIMDYSFPCPCTDLREHYSRVFDELRQLQDLLRYKNILLQEIRDMLLPKLVSGQIDVSELDIDIGVAEQ